MSEPAAAEFVDPRVPRDDGFEPIGAYAVIGDGRTVALVARDGSIDWLCLPDLDSPSAFAALLDPERGGRFSLAPEPPYRAWRRYLPETNVLETTFATERGRVRVTDAMLLPVGGLAPDREVVRRIEGLAGSVPLAWSLEPRFGFGRGPTKITRRAGVPVAVQGSDALALGAWGAGDPELSATGIAGRFVSEAGSESMLALSIAHADPLVLPARSKVEARLAGSIDFWRGWAKRRQYDGPWRAAVVRSALVLKLLIHSPSGAIAAAATTSLPEEIGGVRNWDYRFSWVRDASATLDALLRLGCPAEADAFFWWLMHASQLTHPRLRVLYRLDGGTRVRERELGNLRGYRDSRPVRIGNAAAPQLQLDVYGHLLQTAWLYCGAGGRLDRDTARRLAATADLVCDIWRQPDAGIWEVRSEPRHFTESKMMCALALDRAEHLAEAGHLPSADRPRWRREAAAIRGFVDERCWSQERRSYGRFPEARETDASLLLPVMLGYGDGADRERLLATVRRIEAELGQGWMLRRYRGDDGVPGGEGAFLPCSFWLVDALARLGLRQEAEERMAELAGAANDLGLYSEEIDPKSGELLGNFPQGLTHLALINAAVTLEEERR